MTHVFYLFAIFYIFIELVVLLMVNRIHDLLKKQDLELVIRILSVFYLIFCLIGLMSSQWLEFEFLVLIALVAINIRKLWCRYANTILSIILLLFIVLNKYHFHVDLFTLIFK